MQASISAAAAAGQSSGHLHYCKNQYDEVDKLQLSDTVRLCCSAHMTTSQSSQSIGTRAGVLCAGCKKTATRSMHQYQVHAMCLHSVWQWGACGSSLHRPSPATDWMLLHMVALMAAAKLVSSVTLNLVPQWGLVTQGGPWWRLRTTSSASITSC